MIETIATTRAGGIRAAPWTAPWERAQAAWSALLRVLTGPAALGLHRAELTVFYRSADQISDSWGDLGAGLRVRELYRSAGLDVQR